MDIAVVADLQVQDGATARALNVVDFTDGVATEATLATALTRLGDILAQLQGVLTVIATIPGGVTLTNPPANPETGLAKETTLAQVRDRADYPLPAAQVTTLTPPANPADYPLPAGQIVTLTPPAFPATYPLPSAQVTALTPPTTVTVANPTANPETGLAKDATLAARASETKLEAVRALLAAPLTMANPTANPETGLAKDVTLTNGNLRGTVAISNPTANPETGLAKTLDVQAVRDRLPATLEDGSLSVSDTYGTLEALPSQAGANGILTFTFAAPRVLVWARSRGGVSYARVGADPASGVGVPLADDEPHPLTVRTSELRVWAPTGATVFCWGYV